MLKRLVPTPGYHGWTIAAVGLGCSALTGPGQSYLLSLYLDHLVADLGLSRVQLSALYSGATLAAAAALPFIGRVSDRMPSRRFLGGVLLLLAFAFLHMAAVRGAVTVAISFFALRFLAQGAIGLGTITVTVRWFRRFRSRALAFVTIGYAVGEMMLPAIVLGLIATVGWRGSWVVLAAAYGLVFAPAAYRLLRERDPEREPLDGLPPREPGPPRSTRSAALLAIEEKRVELGQALRMPVFWGLLLVVAVSPLVATGVIFHQVGFFTSRGWAPALVAPAFMCYAAGSMLAMAVTGLALEHVPSRTGISVALTMLVIALSTAWLPLAPAAAALVYGSMLGLASGTMASANAVVWPDYFGIAALGSIKGVVNAVRNGATALGPPLVAALITPEGGYGTAVTVMALLAAAGALGAMFCRVPDVAPPPAVAQGAAGGGT